MSAVAQSAVVAVDWGTTAFRLWALDRGGCVNGEFREDQGMSRLAPEGFEPVLEAALRDLGIGPDVPVVICGMAGAAQGWREARYLSVPASLEDISRHAVQVPNATRDIRILPGLCQSHPAADVMRGEETQLSGAITATGRADGVFCMPGTHSKWVWLEDGQVMRFATFMTGELFGLLSRHSTLSAAMRADPNPELDPSFSDAIRTALGAPQSVMQQLFSVRATPLVHGSDSGNMTARLSGLLIGAELASAQMKLDGRVTLIATGSLGKVYQQALAIAGYGVTAVDAEFLVRRGLFRAAQRLWPDRLDTEGSDHDT